MTYDYDCVVMKKVDNIWSCFSNSIINETLSDAEDLRLATDGYFFRELDSLEVHIIINRLDLDGLEQGSDEFHIEFS